MTIIFDTPIVWENLAIHLANGAGTFAFLFAALAALDWDSP